MRRRSAPRCPVAKALIIVGLMIATITACSPDRSPTTDASTFIPTQEPTSSPRSSGPPSTDPAATKAAPTWPPFASSVQPVTTDRLGVTWRPGCPVGAEALRLVTVTYASFDGGAATGELIVAARVVDDVIAAFRELYEARFPIRKMITMEAYAGDDLRASAEDNTSGFNCRNVLGTDRWSQHSYGLAVDINPLENPYVVGDEIRPPAGAAYLDRTDVRPGMIIEGDVVFRAFTARGFEWGGTFVSTPDFQHFAWPR